jgi:hypothetical protein
MNAVLGKSYVYLMKYRKITSSSGTQSSRRCFRGNAFTCLLFVAGETFFVNDSDITFSTFHSAAFAPTKTSTQSTQLNAWINDQVGITPPVGFFDPLGLSNGKDEKTMRYYRESELKHGRVAMAACLGWYLNAGGVHPAFNSELSNDPLKAMVELPLVGWLQFVLGCGGEFFVNSANTFVNKILRTY